MSGVRLPGVLGLGPLDQALPVGQLAVDFLGVLSRRQLPLVIHAVEDTERERRVAEDLCEMTT